MRDDAITKMYAGLTDKERAALAFDYLMRADDVERKRIEAAMPEQYFIGLPLEYRRWTLNLQSLAMLYAIEYWRHVALAQMAMYGASTMLSDTDDPAQWKPMIKHFEEAEVKLLSLEAAFDDVCVEHGINPAAIRKLAGERHYTVIGIPPDGQAPEPNSAMVAEIKAIWSKLLD